MIEEKENEVVNHAENYRKKVDELFQKKLLEARANKEERRRKLLDFLNDPEVQAYYNNPENIIY